MQLRGIAEEKLSSNGHHLDHQHGYIHNDSTLPVSESMEHQVFCYRQLLDGLADETIELDEFLRHNIVLCASLAQEADGHHHQHHYGTDITPPPAAAAATTSYHTTSAIYTNNNTINCSPASISLLPSYIAAAESAMLGSLHMDALVLGLSDAYELLRMIENDVASLAATLSGANKSRWVAPQEFKRITRKFWVLPHNVFRFKVCVLKHLPILIYGDRQKITEIDPGVLPFLSPPSNKDSSSISSVYLDALPHLPIYHGRLRRVDGATAVRVRWYGDRDPGDPQQQLFVERKTHREAYTNEYSSKERAPLQQQFMAGFLGGKQDAVPLHGGGKEGEFLKSVQNDVLSMKQGPVLRTTYFRTAFQLSTDNLVRVSLDMNVTMSKESSSLPHSGDGCGGGGGGGVSEQDWLFNSSKSPSMEGSCHHCTALEPPSYMHSTQNDDDHHQHPPQQDGVVYFPYAIVEIKLQSDPPEWLQELVVQSEMLLAVPKFSKYLHGCAVLYQEHTGTLLIHCLFF